MSEDKSHKMNAKKRAMMLRSLKIFNNNVAERKKWILDDPISQAAYGGIWFPQAALGWSDFHKW